MHDEVQRRLDALARELVEEWAGCATVRRREASGLRFVDVGPTAPDARGFIWTECLQRGGGALQLEVGAGGRWELGATLADAQFIEDVARAVIAGRVVETRGPGRARVDVTLPSGEVVSGSVYVAPRGCLPLPGWRRRDRRVAYAPYRGDAR